MSGCVVRPRRSTGQSKEETCQPAESEGGGEEAKNYTSVAPTMWLGAQNGWSVPAEPLLPSLYSGLTQVKPGSGQTYMQPEVTWLCFSSKALRPLSCWKLEEVSPLHQTQRLGAQPGVSCAC